MRKTEDKKILGKYTTLKPSYKTTSRQLHSFGKKLQVEYVQLSLRFRWEISLLHWKTSAFLVLVSFQSFLWCLLFKTVVGWKFLGSGVRCNITFSYFVAGFFAVVFLKLRPNPSKCQHSKRRHYWKERQTCLILDVRRDRHLKGMRKEEVFKEVKKEGKDNISFFLSRSLCRTVALISFPFTPLDVYLERIGQTKVYKKFDETDTRNHRPLFSLNVSGKINESWVNDVIMDHEINTNHQVIKWRRLDFMSALFCCKAPARSS